MRPLELSLLLLAAVLSLIEAKRVGLVFSVDFPDKKYSHRAGDFVKEVVDLLEQAHADALQGNVVSYDEAEHKFFETLVNYGFLPTENKIELLNDPKTEEKFFPSKFYEAIFQSQYARLKGANATLFRKEDDVLADLNEAADKFNWLNQTSSALQYFTEKDPSMGGHLKNFLEEAKDHYESINTEEGKQFVRNAVEYLYNHRQGPFKLEEDMTYLTDEFSKLNREQAKNVVQKMSWFIKPYFKIFHGAYVAIVETAKMPFPTTAKF